MDGGAWWAGVNGVAKSQTRLSDFTFTFHFHALEKEMATHSSVLALRIPGTGKPAGLLSMGSHRVGHDWSNLAAAAAAAAYMPSTGIAESYGSFIISFVRNLHTALQSVCICLHSYPIVQEAWFPFSTLSPAFVCRFLMMASLTGVRWYLVVVFICVSVIMNGIFSCVY